MASQEVSESLARYFRDLVQEKCAHVSMEPGVIDGIVAGVSDLLTDGQSADNLADHVRKMVDLGSTRLPSDWELYGDHHAIPNSATELLPSKVEQVVRWVRSGKPAA
jgi:dihydroxyacetone kinase DhaKLM complex PTS-EIIA-like component DhaM